MTDRDELKKRLEDAIWELDMVAGNGDKLTNGYLYSVACDIRAILTASEQDRLELAEAKRLIRDHLGHCGTCDSADDDGSTECGSAECSYCNLVRRYDREEDA